MDELKFKLEFEEPLLVSENVQLDQLEIGIKEPGVFKSLTNGLVLEASKALTLRHPIQRQMPKGLKEESVASAASTAGGSSLSIVIITIVA